jgi:uncharacterized protein (DUF1501 family)
MTSRRDFLRIGVTTLGAIGATGVLMNKFGRFTALASAAASNANAPYSALVCINLSGGNDGNNMVVPVTTSQNSYQTYANSRLSLALPNVGSANGLLPITTLGGEQYGLHPSMPEVASLFNGGQVGVLANVGMLAVPLNPPAGKTPAQLFNQYGGGGPNLPVNLFSHSDQSSQWQTVVPTGISSTGWGGRMADVLQSLYNANGQFPSVVNNGGCGPFCNGTNNMPATVATNGLTGLTGAVGDPARTNGFGMTNPNSPNVLNFDNGLKLVNAANGIANRGIAQGQLLSTLLAKAPPLKTAFPGTSYGLAAQLKMVAEIIQVQQQLGVNRQIFFCSLGGFDTHGTELSLQGPLLQQLSQAMGAFYQATVDLGVQNAVTTFTTSEFGRTIMPNGNAGTDHAWGNHHFVMGGAVKGQQIFGQYPQLTLGALNPLDVTGRGSLVPTTSVDQYAATLAQWFGVPPPDPNNPAQNSLKTVLPNISNFPVTDLGFFG